MNGWKTGMTSKFSWQKRSRTRGTCYTLYLIIVAIAKCDVMSMNNTQTFGHCHCLRNEHKQNLNPLCTLQFWPSSAKVGMGLNLGVIATSQNKTNCTITHGLVLKHPLIYLCEECVRLACPPSLTTSFTMSRLFFFLENKLLYINPYCLK